MNTNLKVCSTCLSTGRLLTPIHKMRRLFREIQYLELIYDTGAMCWQCRNIIKKFHKFKSQALKAQKDLFQIHIKEPKSYSSLTSQTKTLYDYEYLYHTDPLANCNNEPKDETFTIKNEIDEIDIIDDDFKTSSGNNVDKTTVDENNKTVKIESDNENNFSDNLDTIHENIDVEIDEKLEESNQENVYVDSVNVDYADNTANENINNRTVNQEGIKYRSKKEDVAKNVAIIGDDGIEKKFYQVTFTEDEMIKSREEKRNHPNYKKMPFKCESCVLGFQREDTYKVHMEKKHDEEPTSYSSLTSQTKTLYDYEYLYHTDPLANCNNEPKDETITIKNEIDEIEIINDDFKTGSGNNIVKTTIDNNGTVKIESDNENNFNDKLDTINENIDVEMDEKLEKSNQEIENVYVDSVNVNDADNTANENINNRTVNQEGIKYRSKKDDIAKNVEIIGDDGIENKFYQVTFTEDEMIKSREEKRNHPNYKKVPFKCDSCVLGFQREDTYKVHVEKKHDEAISTETCDVCAIRLPNRLAIVNHRQKHYIYYKCRFCKYDTVELWAMLNHCKNKHSDDSEDRIHCKQCNMVAKTQEELEEHVQSQHTLYCNQCGQRFKAITTLKTHLSNWRLEKWVKFKGTNKKCVKFKG